MFFPNPRQTVLTVIALIGIGSVFLIGSVQADEYTEINVQDLKALLDSGNPVFLLNPLSDLEFNEGHIPNSVNVPLHTLATSDQLPADLNTPVITYCLGRK